MRPHGVAQGLQLAGEIEHAIGEHGRRFALRVEVVAGVGEIVGEAGGSARSAVQPRTCVVSEDRPLMALFYHLGFGTHGAAFPEEIASAIARTSGYVTAPANARPASA